MVIGLPLLLLVCSLLHVASGDANEGQHLKVFMQAVDQRHVLRSNWTGDDPCAYNWMGIVCEKGVVYTLTLESMGLAGTLPNNTLSALANLRRISLKNNSLSGPLPDLSSSARSLLAIWLHHNQFSGAIPDALFARTRRLKKLFLSNNQLSGTLPSSLAYIANISDLHLECNQLSGGLPPFNQVSLQEFNVSFNRLAGPIPATGVMQQRFNEASYMGNPGLCGPPLPLQCSGAMEAPLPAEAPSPDESQPDVVAPSPWDDNPSGALTVMQHGHGRKNALLAVLVGLFLLF